ncbi:MAG: fasciclin [Bacteroidales bacterium]|nr:fasciclin [Bacteroidales bacterium]
MKKKTIFYGLLGLMGCVAGLLSCDDLSKDPHYAVPDWLKGSAYEVLEQEGNYTTFLRGIDLSGYTPIVKGKSILTVMAPDDDAFKTYLQQEGFQSIDEMYAARPDEVSKLIGFHLLYYAFGWDNLVNFRPEEGDAATADERMTNAGCYYKFRTKSSDPIVKEWTGEDSVLVYHFERFIPVFSTQLFATKGIDPAYNYEYFFPGTTWTGGSHAGKANGFNVSNAAVLDDEQVVTDNGYLYHVSQVLRPLESIYTELKNNEDYSVFFDLYNSYSEYVKDAELTTDFGNGQDIYLHNHPSLVNIACEWPVSNYRNMSELSRVGYNVFAPSNDAIASFFTSYWTATSGYNSLSDLDPLIMRYFIFQSFGADNFIAFPEEIKNGKVLTKFGTPINIDPDQVTWRQMCCNGALYGMDQMTPPAIFSSVIGSAFRETRFLPYLYALDGSDLVLALASQNSEFVALIPDTAQFRGSNIRFETVTGGHELQVLSEDASYVAMSSSALRSLVNMNVSASASSLPATGMKVIETNTAFNYWYVVDGKITTSALFNKQLNPTYTDEIYFPFAPLEKDATAPNSGRWDNGSAYTYSSPSVFMPGDDEGLNRTLAVCNDNTYPYYLFSQLLTKAGLVESQALKVVMGDARFIAFVPTNDAIKARIKEIPGCSGCSVSDTYQLSGTPTKAALANYLRSYFLTSDLTPFSVYPYPGSGLSGTFDTFGAYKLKITDDGTSLKVNFIDKEGTEGPQVDLFQTAKYHSLPFSYSDGAFHLINDILL